MTPCPAPLSREAAAKEEITPLLIRAAEIAQKAGVNLACFMEAKPGEIDEVVACPVEPTFPFGLGLRSFRCKGNLKKLILIIGRYFPEE
jgi:hypothetical protein